MERKGPLHRLKPISNAFVVYGNCLACSDGSGHTREEDDDIEEEKHEIREDETKDKPKVSQ